MVCLTAQPVAENHFGVNDMTNQFNDRPFALSRTYAQPVSSSGHQRPELGRTLFQPFRWTSLAGQLEHQLAVGLEGSVACHGGTSE